MSDARLRELDRAWRQSGSPQDHAALISARLRAGALTTERVTLASHLRSEAAALVCDPPEVTLSHGSHGLPGGMARRLSPLGGWSRVIETDQQAGVRAAISVISWAVPRLVAGEESAGQQATLRDYRYVFPIAAAGVSGVSARALALVDSATRLALDWTQDNLLRAISCSLRADTQRQQHFVGMANLHWLSALGHGGLTTPPVEGWLEEVCYGSITWSENGLDPFAGCTEHKNLGALERTCWACLFRDVRSVQARVNSDLVPWLLGDGDPLVDRRGNLLQQGQQGGDRNGNDHDHDDKR